jgi:hypothetical protein
MSEAFKKQLETHLQKQSKAELVEHLLLLYEQLPEVADFYRLRLNQTADDVFERYCRQIQQALYPDERFEGGMDIDEVDHLIFTLDKLGSKVQIQIKIRIYAVQEATQLAHAYGGDYGDDFYIYFEDLYEAALKKIKQSGLLDKYQHEMLQTAQNAFDGYGHHDTLMEHYNEYYG